MIRIGEHWLADFASCNYLGFDLDREIIEAVPAHLDAWGTHPSWSRLLGSPVLYEQIEERLTALLGAEDSLVLPTITHIHMSVIPLLAASGTIFLDQRAHKTIYDGCQVARSRGAAVRRFRFEDPDHLDQLLSAERDPTRLVCMDGVNSMTGNAPDLPAFAAVARKHGALLYVDDAHGFGVIGERTPGETSPFGARGNSVVRHTGETYDNLVLVGGFSKAYSSLLAFIACPTEVKQLLKVAAPPYLYSGPSPVASLATVLAGLDVNETRGDAMRAELWRLTDRVLQALDRIGVHTPNRSGFPIIEIPLRDHRRIAEVGQMLFDRGVYVTLAAYPLVPKHEVGFRLQVTAANTDAEIDTAIEAIEELAAARRALRGGRAADGAGRVTRVRGVAGRAAAWQLLLAGGALLCALYVWVPPFKGSGPVMNVLGLLPVAGDPRRRPPLPPRREALVAVLRARLRAVLARRPLHVLLPARLRRRGAVPVDRRRDVPPRLPGAHDRAALARAPPQPARRPPRPHRRADHDAGPRARLVGRAHRAVHPRRHDGRLREARVDRVPGGRHPAPRRRHPPRRRRRPPRPRVRLPLREHHRAARHRLRLRRRDAERRLRRPGHPRRRLDQLLPPLGRRGAAPVDARALRARPRARAAPVADPPRAPDVRDAHRARRRDRRRDSPRRRRPPRHRPRVGRPLHPRRGPHGRPRPPGGALLRTPARAERRRLRARRRDRARRALRGGHAVGRRAVPRRDERVRAPRGRRAADRRGPRPRGRAPRLAPPGRGDDRDAVRPGRRSRGAGALAARVAADRHRAPAQQRERPLHRPHPARAAARRPARRHRRDARRSPTAPRCATWPRRSPWPSAARS